ncbi:MAG: VIT domain-containing protein [Pseudomonadota bacterium]
MRRTLVIAIALSGLLSPAAAPAGTVVGPAPAARLSSVEGLVDVRPENAARWTPAEDRQEILPGDEIRCGARGPNGAALVLHGGGDVILGPGGLLRMETGGRLALVHGELAVMSAGPGTPKEGVWRADKGGLKKLSKEPTWVDGFVNLNPREAMGALLANVDGREVSLTLGYHKVTVDVRDQIARTVIEESFVNHTDEILEGVFQFPLPQDASISNFGMWIGDRLVEADVVEKQRAREIYETIKREKRDPGLLEWAGGSLFKARVYPIPAHTEKRVTITYTQVLPLRNGTWTYDYALRSDLLRAHPLRTLELDVRIHSEAGLSAVTCPTHPARVETTAQGARIRFEAQEYRPDADFQVVVTPKTVTSGVRTLTHQRGDDGYFMVLFQPPEAAAPAGRTVLPDGEPLKLLLMADTSGSMDADTRRSQEAFLQVLLGALRPEDRFRLAACDATCVWADPDFVAADDGSRARALAFLGARESLGWTDLDALVQAALGASGPDVHVIYVGDGRHSAGDADTAALAARLGAMGKVKAASIHAVAPGNLVEPPVMAALAALGGGSYRQIRDGDGPRTAAREILQEILVPGVRDVRFTFEGFTTAKVYPEILPNLAAGTQHVVVGRYRPGQDVKAGRVVIRGRTREGERTWTEDVTFAGADQGNSFIPRLWARRYLDALLQGGADVDRKERIVSFSQEFRILTPYTSFLVLESDADRERFGVKRHFQMRDGEVFFAEGRARTDFALARKAMAKAATWRTRLRSLVLASMADMGRDLAIGQDLSMRYPVGNMGWGFGGGRGRATKAALDLGIIGGNQSWDFESSGDLAQGFTEQLDGLEEAEKTVFRGSKKEMSKREEMSPDAMNMPAEMPATEEPMSPPPPDMGGDTWADSPAMDGRLLPSAGESVNEMQRMVSDELLFATAQPVSLSGKDVSGFGYGAGYRRQTAARSSLLHSASLSTVLSAAGPSLDQAWWFQRLVGYLYDAPEDAAPVLPKKPAPEVLRALSARLYRGDGLHPDAALEIRRVTHGFSPARGTIQSESDEAVILAGTRWIHQQRSSGSDGRLAWCDGKEYVAALLPFDLGWRRPAKAVEGLQAPMSIGAFLLAKLEDSYPEYAVTVTRDDPSRSGITLRWSPPGAKDGSRDIEVRIVVDETRSVVSEIAYKYGAAPATRTVFDDFVQVRDAWWPGRTESFDGEGRKTAESKLTYRALDAAGVAKAAKDAAARLGDAILFQRALPAVDEARERAGKGKGSREDHLTLLLTDGLLQRWDLAFQHLDALDGLHPKAPGLRWVRVAMEVQSRRHQEMKALLLSLADGLARHQGSAEAWSQARYLMEQGPQVLQANEVLELMDRLGPVYALQPDWTTAQRTFAQNRMSWLRSAGRNDEADEAELALFERYPDDYSVVQQYSWSLRNRGDFEESLRVLRVALEEHGPYEVWEESTLRSQWSQFLADQGRLEEALKLVEGWIGKNLDQAQLYDQYLSLLVRTGRPEKAREVVLAWIAAGVDSPADDAAATARLQASVNLMLGQGYMLYTYTVEKEWIPALTDLAIRLGPVPSRFWIVSQVLSHQGVRQHGADREIRAAWLEILLAKMPVLEPAVVQQMAGQLLGGEPTVPPETWMALAKGASERMDAAPTAQERHVWSDVVVQLLASHGDNAAEVIRFLRERYEWTDDLFRVTDRDTLFRALLSQPWSPALEAELLNLALTFTSEAEVEAAWLRVSAFQWVTDWMLRGRVTKAAEAWKEKEDLTRNLQRSLILEATRDAHLAVAVALLELDGPSPLQDWITLEITYHEILGGKPAGPIAVRLGEMLDREELRFPKDVQPAQVLRERLVVSLEYLATRKDAEPALATALLARFEQALKDRPGERYWRTHKARVLMALDRPEALEEALRSWLDEGGSAPAWRRTLGYLLAETGRITEAIAHFEALRGSGQLMGHEWATLADWYLVEGRRSDRDGANLERFLAMPEYELSNLYYTKSSQTGVTGVVEVDEEILAILTALLQKSQYPANYIWQIQTLFQQTREPRLLNVVAKGLLGHSPGGVYPVLENIRYLLQEIQDEASVDAVVEAIEGALKDAKSPVDRRALDLLLVAAERRAAELINQPGAHGRKALAALARAEKGVWQDGERRLMAGFLAGLGAITWDELATAQRRTLTTLLDGEAPGTEDHLAVASYLATVRWVYGMQAQAIAGMLRAVNAYLDARKGVLSAAQNQYVESLVGYMEIAGQHRDAEALLGRIEDRAATAGQRWWARNRALGVQAAALQVGGTASTGTGTVLYEALRNRLIEELATQPSQNHNTLLSTLTRVFYAARERRIGDPAGDLRRFVRDSLPAVLAAQTNELQNIVGQIADCLQVVASVREALAFLIERLEQEPDWYAQTNQSGWNWHGYRLGNLRRLAGPLGALDARLFAIVATQLRRELATRQRVNAVFYHSSYGDFWAEKAQAFAKITREVLAANPDDGPLIEYAAQYLWDGLKLRGDAIAILAEAWARDLLSEQGGRTLVGFLFSESRFADAIPVLRKIIKLHPRDQTLLSQLLEGLCKTGQRGEFKKLLATTESDFSKEGLWTWSAQTTFAAACHRCGAWSEAARLYEAGIDGYLAAGVRYPQGDGNLSSWYVGLADAYSGLGDTAKAVDAASGSVVAWGQNQSQRQAALGTLTRVLEGSKDLDAYIRIFEREVEETGLENTTVRRALGQVLVARSRDDAALRQFEKAIEVSRWDPDLWDGVVEIHRRQGRFARAASARLGACRARPVEFACWGEAATLFGQAGDAGAAERARTSIVESAPDEADAHEALARVLQSEGRWMDALGRWRQVTRLREGTPGGWLGMAAAAVEAKVWDEAERAVDHILSRTWPRIFEGVINDARILKRTIDSRRRPL